MPKPVVFFSSGREDAELLNVLASLVTTDWALPDLWTEAFQTGETLLNSLRERAGRAQFCVILYTSRGVVNRRGHSRPAPNDNLLFELGFFSALLGERNVVVVVSRGNRPELPSNYDGYLFEEYDPSEGEPPQFLQRSSTRIRSLFATTSRPEVEPEQQPTGDAPPETEPDSNGESGLIVPIYRDLFESLNWYRKFEEYVKPATPALPSEMLYYGPGLAEAWIRLAANSDANQQQLEAFNRDFVPLLSPYASGSLSVVDLGVGDFEKGKRVLRHLLESDVSSLSYFPLDISYQMLALALGEMPLFERLKKQRGSVACINTSFSQLGAYREIISTGSRTLFLLLGNTLGNELDEVAMLRDIGAAMDADDLLFAELQLLESEPIPDEEITDSIQDAKAFYAGPFIALGYPEHEIELRAETSCGPWMTPTETATVRFICRPSTRHVLRHPTFASKKGVRISPEVDITVYVVRKYHPSAIEAIFERAGLDVVDSSVSDVGDSGRRFSHLIARKRS